MSKKKKPAKGKKIPQTQPDEMLRDAISDIVNDLYVEVEAQAGIRLAALQQRCDELAERLAAVEQRFAGFQKPQPTTWLGRLHARRWFCLPWCRY